MSVIGAPAGAFRRRAETGTRRTPVAPKRRSAPSASSSKPLSDQSTPTARTGRLRRSHQQVEHLLASGAFGRSRATREAASTRQSHIWHSEVQGTAAGHGPLIPHGGKRRVLVVVRRLPRWSMAWSIALRNCRQPRGRARRRVADARTPRSNDALDLSAILRGGGEGSRYMTESAKVCAPMSVMRPWSSVEAAAREGHAWERVRGLRAASAARRSREAARGSTRTRSTKCDGIGAAITVFVGVRGSADADVSLVVMRW